MTAKDSENLPEEWVELIKEAMESNITKEEFKKFLKEQSKIIKD